MKKILLSMMTICVFAIVNKTTAQCSLAISNLKISAAPGVSVGDGTVGNPVRCQTTFDAEFDITTNSGFKYLFFHSWLLSDYPSIFNCGGNSPSQDPGNVTQLGTTIYEAGKSILDFGFIGLKDIVLPAGSEVNVTGNIATTPNYPNNDNNSGKFVALNTASAAYVTRSSTNSNILHFRVVGLVVEILGACGPITVKTDIWGSNGNVAHDGMSNSKIGAQCYVCGLGQSLNDPTISLIKFCGSSPFRYDIGMATSNATSIHVVYRLYAHDPLLGGDSDPSDPLIYTSDTIIFNSLNAYDPAPANLPSPYCCFAPWTTWGIYAVVTARQTEFTNNISSHTDYGTSCATLPVNLKSFTAVRKNASNVNLKWETAQEQDNKGFYVERKLSNGAWQSISFVESGALNGNSNSPLTYDFTDMNNAKGVTQYRLRQLDINGKQGYSLIRSVRGEGQKNNTIIYPNPSGDGKVNIVFDDAGSVRDVSLIDVSGKTLKQWKGVTNNNIRIDNLNAGFYTVRIVNVETGEQVVEKFIVNKR